MRLPEPVKRYADRVDAMSLRERVLIFLAVAVVVVAIADSAFFEPLLRRQKANSLSVQQQQDEIRAMQAQVQAFAQARSGESANAKRQRLEKRKAELAALDREMAEKHRGLVTSDRMAKMLSETQSGHRACQPANSGRCRPGAGLVAGLRARRFRAVPPWNRDRRVGKLSENAELPQPTRAPPRENLLG
jgi:TolA-binding protein